MRRATRLQRYGRGLAVRPSPELELGRALVLLGGGADDPELVDGLDPAEEPELPDLSVCGAGALRSRGRAWFPLDCPFWL